jgi:DNA-binding CsgD family transcriptional regulator
VITLQRLEEINRRDRKKPISQLIDEAVELYARFRRSDEVAAYEQLTPRLRDVLRMIGEGSSTKEIAHQLRVSLKTAEFHRNRLKKKLNIDGIAGLVRYAIRVGVIMP